VYVGKVDLKKDIWPAMNLGKYLCLENT